MSQRFCAEDDYTSSYNELSNARFLSRQGLAFRGDGEELDSNFMRLIYLRSEDNTKLVD